MIDHIGVHHDQSRESGVLGFPDDKVSHFVNRTAIEGDILKIRILKVALYVTRSSLKIIGSSQFDFLKSSVD